MAEGENVTKASTDRVSGWAEILTRLGDVDRGVAPRLFIHQRCQRLLATLPNLQHDPNRPEDVLKVDADEAAWETALRELGEETGWRPGYGLRELWTLPSVNAHYDWEADRVVLAPAFAAEVEGEPVLDSEHDQAAWLPAEAAAQRLAWPEQSRLVRLAAALAEVERPIAWSVPLDAHPMSGMSS